MESYLKFWKIALIKEDNEKKNSTQVSEEIGDEPEASAVQKQED